MLVRSRGPKVVKGDFMLDTDSNQAAPASVRDVLL